MGLKKTVKKQVKRSFQPTRWMGMDYLKDNGKLIGSLVSSLFGAKTDKTQRMSFDECVKHYGLSAEDIKQRIKTAYIVSLLCSVLGCLVFLYMIYQFVNGLILGGFICIILSLILWAYAFREHFIYFQLKRRNFSLHFKDWLNFIRHKE